MIPFSSTKQMNCTTLSFTYIGEISDSSPSVKNSHGEKKYLLLLVMKRGRKEEIVLKAVWRRGQKKSIEIWPKARKFAEKIVESFPHFKYYTFS